jgi:GNAT superfamily N-acetyltransferase
MTMAVIARKTAAPVYTIVLVSRADRLERGISDSHAGARLAMPPPIVLVRQTPPVYAFALTVSTSHGRRPPRYYRHMDEQILLRLARPDEIPVLVDLRERMLIELGSDDAARLADLRERSMPWFREAFAQGRALGWIAERHGLVVGGVTMTLNHLLPQYRSPSGNVASLLGLYVLPDVRGDGIATALVRTALDHARSWGADLVTLHAADKARPIYERLGFVQTKEMRLQFSELEAGQSPGGCGV